MNTPQKRKRTTTAPPPTPAKTVSLSTKIHRILNKTLELKHWSYDVNQGQSSQLYSSYSNFVSGIVQGASAGQRLGDRINIHSITVTWVRASVVSGAEQFDNLQRCLVVRSNDKSLQTQALTSISFTDIVFSSFNVSGPIQTNNYKVWADRKQRFIANEQTAPGSALREQSFTYKFPGNGYNVQYTPGTSVAVQGSNLVILESRANNYPVGLNWTHYLGVTVAFRDA